MHSKTEKLWWNFWLVLIHCGSVTSHVTVLRSSAVTIGTSRPSLYKHIKAYIQHCMDLQLAVDPYKKVCSLKAWIDFQKHTESVDIFLQIKYQPNIHQCHGGIMIWGVRIAISTEIRHLVEELITFLSIFGLQKWGILTARLNKSLSISTSIQWEGISVLKHAQNLLSQQD